MSFSQAWSITTPSPKVAALASGGVFIDANGTASFVSSTSANAVWSSEPVISFQSRVDAGASTLAVLRFQMANSTSPRIPTVTRFSPSGPLPLWAYQFPLQVNSTSSGLHVSQDGQTIAAWVFTYQAKPAINPSPANGQVVDVAVLGPQSSTPLRYFSVFLYGQPRCTAMSPDGTKLLLVSALKYVVVNLATGQLVLDGFNTTDVGSACSVSSDGQTVHIARSRQYVDVYVRGFAQAPIASSNTAAVARSIRDQVIGWSDGVIFAGAERITSAAGMVDCDVSPDGSVIASTSGGPTIFERSGATWAQSLAMNIVGTNDIDVSNDLVCTVANNRVDLFKRNAAPVHPDEYRCTIPWPAVQGTVHQAIAVPAGSGPSIPVRVE